MAQQAQLEAQDLENAQVAATIGATTDEAARAAQDDADQENAEADTTPAEEAGPQDADQDIQPPVITPAVDLNPNAPVNGQLPDELRGSSIIFVLDPEGPTHEIEEWPHQILYDVPAQGGTCAVCSYSILKDGRYLAAGFEDGILRIWDIHTNAITHKVAIHKDAVLAVAFSPTENTRLASGSGDRSAMIYDLAAQETIRTFDQHDGHVWTVAYSSDGKILATGCSDAVVRIFDVTSGNLLRNLQSDPYSAGDFLSFSPDGKRLFSRQGSTGRIRDPISKEVIGRSHKGELRGMPFFPQGDRSIPTDPEQCHIVRTWNSSGDNLLTDIVHTKGVWSAAWSHDCKEIVVGSFDETSAISGSVEGKLVGSLCERP